MPLSKNAQALPHIANILGTLNYIRSFICKEEQLLTYKR